MALKTFKPVTPSLRQLVIVDRSGLYKGKPVKTLTEGKSSKGGRNNMGRITVRFRGGGHKQAYRLVDFKRRKLDVVGLVLFGGLGNDRVEAMSTGATSHRGTFAKAVPQWKSWFDSQAE